MSDPGFTASPPPPADHTPRYCLRCQSPLRPYHLESPCCPQCFLPFDPTNPATYTTRRSLLLWELWLPTLALAMVTGAVAYTIIWWSGELGVALFCAVPLSVGAILGYLVRPSIWLAMAGSIFAVCCIAGIVVFLGLHGIFCGAILGAVFVGPALFGCFVGWMLRLIFREVSSDYRRNYFIGLFLVIPYAGSGIERFIPRPATPVEVRTGMDFPAATRETWESVVFYEQVEHEPPWLLTFGLPRPLGTDGGDWTVGQRKRCRYERGCYLVKQITARTDERLLAFRVVEQHLPLEGCKRRCNDYTLTGGSFTLEPLSEGRTRVVLTTNYDRRMRPGIVFEPIERRIIQELHAHVLEGMRRRLDKDAGESYPPQFDPPPSTVATMAATESPEGCPRPTCAHR